MKPKNTATALEIELLTEDWHSDERYIADYISAVRDLKEELYSESDASTRLEIAAKINYYTIDMELIKAHQDLVRQKLVGLLAPGTE